MLAIVFLDVLDLTDGGGRTGTNNLRIVSRPAPADSTQLQRDSSADSGKVPQNPRLRRNKLEGNEQD
jgi:hypothetical protein